MSAATTDASTPGAAASAGVLPEPARGARPAHREALPIRLERVSRAFGAGHDVLVDVDLEVRRGEVVAVLGPSGCGKSTLLRLVAGLDVPSAGRVVIGDRPVADVDPRVAVVFQQPRLLPWLDLTANVRLGATRRRRSEPDAGSDAEVHALLERVGLRGFERHRPSSVSGGMAQRTALARALVADPGVLLLDEPFAALDALTRLRMQDLVERITRESGTTVLLVTHDVDEALRLADRVVVLGAAGSGWLQEVAVELPRPRHSGDAATAAALAPLRRHLLSLVGVEA